ncbi:MAG: hypothetical protein ACLPKT_22920 [Methylocella sp.]
MDKPLVGKPLVEFGAAFRAVTSDSGIEVSRPEVSIWLEVGVTPAGAGFVWGRGEINYQGKNHAFRLSGLSIAKVCAASICAAGSVMYLRKLSDFSGNYLTSPDSGLATYLKNERGVVIQLRATDAGQRINVPVNAVRVRLKRQTYPSARTGMLLGST